MLIVGGLTLGGCGDAEPRAGDHRSLVAESSLVELSGVVTFAGTVPSAVSHSTAGDPSCGDEAGTIDVQDVVVADQKLANVFVWISTGLEDRRFPEADDTVMLTQTRCELQPRVLGIRTGSAVRFVNTDPTLMNVHARTSNNGAFNVGLDEHSYETRGFDGAEEAIQIGSDIHRWMRAWIWVLDHPCFAVSDTDGTFRFRLPPGSYRLSARHERLGTQHQEIVVEEGKNVTVSLLFTDGETE